MPSQPDSGTGMDYLLDEAISVDKPDRGFLVGVYSYVDDVLKAMKALKVGNFKIETVYSPVRNQLIISELGLKTSMVRYFTLTGGVLGILTGVGLSVYTAAQWRFIVQGKPAIPAVPYVIEAFEFCILLSVLLNVIGFLSRTRLPRLKIPPYYDPRFSEDRFGVVVRCEEEQWDEVRRTLTETGAEEINVVKA